MSDAAVAREEASALQGKVEQLRQALTEAEDARDAATADLAAPRLDVIAQDGATTDEVATRVEHVSSTDP